MSEQREVDKMLAVSDESQAIGEFIEWLGTKGMWIGSFVKYEDFSHDVGAPVVYSISQLLAMYFEIDLQKVEQEKRTMLEDIRRNQQEAG